MKEAALFGVLIIVVIIYIFRVMLVLKDIRYIKMELRRAASVGAQKHWKKELRLARIECFPFGWWVAERIEKKRRGKK